MFTIQLNSLAEKIEKYTNKKAISNTISIKDSTIVLPSSFTYSPSQTAKAFHTDNSRMRLIMGAIRSGKSTACCAEIVMRACQMPFCTDGIRRCVAVVIRNTYPELETTTIRTWANWWGGLGEVKTNYSSPISFRHIFQDEHGKVELLVWFLALDKPKDISKLLSLEVSFAYVNEIRELPFSVFEHLRGRVGQYPSRNMLENPEEQFWYGIFADTNPPDIDHWIYRLFEVEKPSGFRLFKQPPAMIIDEKGEWENNSLAENINNLPKDYYKELLHGSTSEYKKVYILGEYGQVYDGKVVFANYNDDMHSINKIEIDKGDLYLGWDFGLTPACLLCELDGNTLNVIKEWTTERMYFDELITIVSPFLQTFLKGRTITSICDPAGSAEYLQMLAGAGIETNKSRTNDIEPRLSAVNAFLTRMHAGKAALQIDRVGCPVLRKGFLGKYCYKRVQVVGDEKYRDVPDKTHPYSDIQDCLQYICYAINYKPEINYDKFKTPVKMFNNDWL